ncbi:MAG: YdcF family protein, partial [Clostridia bacterium]|nr:YdcF family protein [Clostridia bacterium]
KNCTVFRLRGLKPGKAQVNVWIISGENEHNKTGLLFECTVLKSGTVYLSGYDFGGHRFLLLGILLLTLFTSAVSLLQFRYHKKSQFFSYKTVLSLGLGMFAGVIGLMYAALVGLYFIFPTKFDSWQVFNFAGIITSAIFALSLPMVVIFAVFLSVSNISLIRHEGFRKNNLFGLLISAMLGAGSIICAVLLAMFPNSTSETARDIAGSVIRTSVSSAFVYFEFLLLATQICMHYAARHEPKYNQDFIMILGCKVRKDGTPPPLLKGRIDRALEFYKNQTEKTGNAPGFIPSGGQGPNEVISEGECMKNYLVENGIEDTAIFPETQSRTTLENMKFSKKIADEKKENANILFSTTNYHIFRSGILSAKAGLRADGIGAKTKWYFWPNAQMREFIGLLANEWLLNLVFIILTVGFATVIANISTIISRFAELI